MSLAQPSSSALCRPPFSLPFISVTEEYMVESKWQLFLPLKGHLPLYLGEKWRLSPSPEVWVFLASVPLSFVLLLALGSVWPRLGATLGRPAQHLLLPESQPTCWEGRWMHPFSPHKIINQMQINVSDFTKGWKIKVTPYKKEKMTNFIPVRRKQNELFSH